MLTELRNHKIQALILTGFSQSDKNHVKKPRLFLNVWLFSSSNDPGFEVQLVRLTPGLWSYDFVYCEIFTSTKLHRYAKKLQLFR